jgi:hypothetical protein
MSPRERAPDHFRSLQQRREIGTPRHVDRRRNGDDVKIGHRQVGCFRREAQVRRCEVRFAQLAGRVDAVA